MKIIYLAIIAASFACLNSCSYNDRALSERVDCLDSRLAQLETIVRNINADIAGIHTVIRAMEDGDRITAVTLVEGGYEITFSKSGTATIRNGRDGKDGSDGVTPVVSARQDADGLYYWTVNGEYLTDKTGAKLPVTSHLTPKVRLNGDDFEISYDNGGSWEVLGPAGSIPPDAIFIKEVRDGTDSVTFVLSDGRTVTIPKIKQFALDVACDGSVMAVHAGSPLIHISYELTGADEGTVVDAFATGGLEVQSVDYDIAGNPESGHIVVRLPDPIPANGKVFIFAVNGRGVTVSRIIRIEEGVFTADVMDNHVPAEGGEVLVLVMTNYNYEVRIPEEARSWIADAPTKAVREDVVVLSVSPNTGAERKAVISFKSGTETLQTFEVTQAAAPAGNPAHTAPIEDWKDGGAVNL